MMILYGLCFSLLLHAGEACFGRLSPTPRYPTSLLPAAQQPIGLSSFNTGPVIDVQPISIDQIGGYSGPAEGIVPYNSPSEIPALIPNPVISRSEPLADGDPKKESETPWHQFINSLTGGQVTPYDGQALSLVQKSEDLSCSFGNGEHCCWHNVRNSADELDWSLTSQHISLGQLDGFQAVDIPSMPALITGAPKTQRWVQAILTSCPIPCQSGDGQLTISHWLSPGVLLDVCRLKVGAREYLDCQQPLKSSGRSTVIIPGLDEPFYVVLVASEFVGESWKYEGGVAIIDDVDYQGAQICVPNNDVQNA